MTPTLLQPQLRMKGINTNEPNQLLQLAIASATIESVKQVPGKHSACDNVTFTRAIAIVPSR